VCIWRRPPGLPGAAPVEPPPGFRLLPDDQSADQVAVVEDMVFVSARPGGGLGDVPDAHQDAAAVGWSFQR
jgi:hypothetical protein